MGNVPGQPPQSQPIEAALSSTRAERKLRERQQRQRREAGVIHKDRLHELLTEFSNSKSKITPEDCVHKISNDFSKFDSLDLSDSKIREEGGEALAYALIKNHGLEVLDLWKNGLRNVGCAALANALVKNRGLMILDISDNNIRAEGARLMAEAISKNHTLHTLYIHSNPIVLDAAGIESVKRMCRLNETLQTVDIVELKGVNSNFRGHTLDLSLKALQHMVLNDFHMGLLSCMVHKNSSIVEAKLDDHPHISSAGLQAILEAVVQAKDVSQLRVLSVKQQWCGTQFAPLNRFPECVVHLSKRFRLEVESRNFVFPPAEVVRNGMRSIRAFFKRLQTGGEEVWRMRLCLIGPAEMGKTSIQRWLRSGPQALPGGALAITNGAPGSALVPVNKSARASSTESSEVPELPTKSERTEGIDVAAWRPPQAAKKGSDSARELSLWDFAGQESYHFTHNFFLTPRAVYMLVLDLSKEVDHFLGRHLQMWLDLVQAKVPGASIIVVGTHIDLVENSEVITERETAVIKLLQEQERARVALLHSRLERLDSTVRRYAHDVQNGRRAPDTHGLEVLEREKAELELQLTLRPRLPHKMHLVSCKTGAGIDLMRQAVAHTCRQRHFPFLGQLIPRCDVALMEEVKQMLDEGLFFIPWDRYQDRCIARCGFESVHALEAATQLLHDLGDLAWYGKDAGMTDGAIVMKPNMQGLRKFVFLDIRWLINLLKRVIGFDLGRYLIYDFDVGSAICMSEFDFDAAREQLLSQGILDTRLLRLLWGDLEPKIPVDLLEALSDLLVEFELAVRLPPPCRGDDTKRDDPGGLVGFGWGSRQIKRLLIPALLPQSLTSICASPWMTHQASERILRRWLVFPFHFPPGIVERLTARALAKQRDLVCWRSGLYAWGQGLQLMITTERRPCKIVDDAVKDAGGTPERAMCNVISIVAKYSNVALGLSPEEAQMEAWRAVHGFSSRLRKLCASWSGLLVVPLSPCTGCVAEAEYGTRKWDDVCTVESELLELAQSSTTLRKKFDMEGCQHCVVAGDLVPPMQVIHEHTIESLNEEIQNRNNEEKALDCVDITEDSDEAALPSPRAMEPSQKPVAFSMAGQIKSALLGQTKSILLSQEQLFSWIASRKAMNRAFPRLVLLLPDDCHQHEERLQRLGWRGAVEECPSWRLIVGCECLLLHPGRRLQYSCEGFPGPATAPFRLGRISAETIRKISISLLMAPLLLRTGGLTAVGRGLPTHLPAQFLSPKTFEPKKIVVQNKTDEKPVVDSPKAPKPPKIDPDSEAPKDTTPAEVGALESWLAELLLATYDLDLPTIDPAFEGAVQNKINFGEMKATELISRACDAEAAEAVARRKLAASGKKGRAAEFQSDGKKALLARIFDRLAEESFTCLREEIGRRQGFEPSQHGLARCVDCKDRRKGKPELWLCLKHQRVLGPGSALQQQPLLNPMPALTAGPIESLHASMSKMSDSGRKFSENLVSGYGTTPPVPPMVLPCMVEDVHDTTLAIEDGGDAEEGVRALLARSPQEQMARSSNTGASIVPWTSSAQDNDAPAVVPASSLPSRPLLTGAAIEDDDDAPIVPASSLPSRPLLTGAAIESAPSRTLLSVTGGAPSPAPSRPLLTGAAVGPWNPRAEQEEEEEEEQEEEMPPGWESAQDPRSGNLYYFNRATGDRQWDRPQVKKAEVRQEAVQGPNAATDRALEQVRQVQVSQFRPQFAMQDDDNDDGGDIGFRGTRTNMSAQTLRPGATGTQNFSSILPGMAPEDGI